MDTRELWLGSLSAEELLALDPWTILTAEKAKKYLLIAGRGVLRKNSDRGLAEMSNDELLHEVYPLLCEKLPAILKSSLAVESENRDRFIFGSLRNLVQMRLNEMVFGCNNPSTFVYLEEHEILRRARDGSLGSSDTVSDSGLMNPNDMFRSHSLLMSHYEHQINEFVETYGSHEPQFLSDGAVVADADIQQRHMLIERFRPYLSSRDTDILRHLILGQDDRNIIALEVGSAPKQISRARQRIQRTMREVLHSLGWADEEIDADILKRAVTAEPFTAGA